jgi:plastocyanin
MHRRRWMLALGLLVAALTLAACGGGDDNGGSSSEATATATETATPTETATEDTGGTSSGGGESLALAAPADGSLKFDKTTLDAKAGKVTIDFDNPSSVPHAVEIEGNGVEEETKTITKGKASVTVDLKPGSYEFYCPVGNHREAGMEGKLTVS